MAYSGSSAANFADSHAEPTSRGNCALYVRRAIEWGGVQIGHTPAAKDMGTALLAAGFYVVTGGPQKGDVVVIQPLSRHPYGHAAIYDGHTWVSDFKQRPGPQGFYPGPEYRAAQPPYKIYRHN